MSALISIVLVEPENADNIGSVARAMKNMGLSNLRLVKPPADYKARGKKMAMSAKDILDKAVSFESVGEAVGDAGLVMGTTRRLGPKRGKFVAFDRAVKKIKKISKTRRVAILFGKESKGLDNDSLDFCDWVISIPAGSAYPSINLAQAVMILVFSLYVSGFRLKAAGREPDYVTKAEILEVLGRFKKALEILGYQAEGHSVVGRIVRTLHGLFKRSGLLASEAQMFRGLSRRISERVKGPRLRFLPPSERVARHHTKGSGAVPAGQPSAPRSRPGHLPL